MMVRTILVVDDSEGDQMLAELMIEDVDEAIEVLQASDGQEALEGLEAGVFAPDLILLDLNMPRMNGLEFLAHYSELDNVKPVVVVSSSNIPKDVESSMAYSCVQNYLVKPLEPDTLEALLS